MLVIHENNKTKSLLTNNGGSLSVFLRSDIYKNNLKNKYDSIIAIGIINIYFNKKDLILDQAVISRKIIENNLLEIYKKETFTSIYKNGMVFIKSGIELYLFTDSVAIQDGTIMPLKSFASDSRHLTTVKVIYVSKGFDIVAEKCKLVDVVSSGNIITYTYVYKNETYKVLCESTTINNPMVLTREQCKTYLPILSLELFEKAIRSGSTLFRTALHNFSLEVYNTKPIVSNNLELTKFNYKKIHIDESYMLDCTKNIEELPFYDCLGHKQMERLKEQYHNHEDKFLLLDKQKELQELNKEIIKLRGLNYEY